MRPSAPGSPDHMDSDDRYQGDSEIPPYDNRYFNIQHLYGHTHIPLGTESDPIQISSSSSATSRAPYASSELERAHLRRYPTSQSDPSEESYSPTHNEPQPPIFTSTGGSRRHTITTPSKSVRHGIQLREQQTRYNELEAQHKQLQEEYEQEREAHERDRQEHEREKEEYKMDKSFAKIGRAFSKVVGSAIKKKKDR